MAIESKMTREPLVNRSPYGQPQESPPKKTRSPWIVTIIVLLLIGGGVWFYFSNTEQKDVLSELEGAGGTQSIRSGEYQAVFLDNGQVYFGKLKEKGEDYILTDVFYLQSGAAGVDQAANLSLTKLGNEAHGPEDRMQINKDHVLFVEDMKNDSKVVKAIQDYQSKK